MQSQHNKQNKQVTGSPTQKTSEYKILSATIPLTRFSQVLSRAFTSACYPRCRPLLVSSSPDRSMCEREKPSDRHEKDRLTYLLVSTTFRRTPEQTGDPFLFHLCDLIFIFFICFEKQYFPSCLSLISASLRIFRLYLRASWLQERSPRYPSVVFYLRSLTSHSSLSSRGVLLWKLISVQLRFTRLGFSFFQQISLSVT